VQHSQQDLPEIDRGSRVGSKLGTERTVEKLTLPLKLVSRRRLRLPGAPSTMRHQVWSSPIGGTIMRGHVRHHGGGWAVVIDLGRNIPCIAGPAAGGIGWTAGLPQSADNAATA
jgi:hypothetical protein